MTLYFFLADSILVIASRLTFLSRTLALCLFISLGSNELFGQTCFCPEPSTCAPCNGGLTRLTLRYNGILAAVVTASDQNGIVYPPQAVGAGTTISFTGSISNEKFVGPYAYVTIVGIGLSASIPTDCGGGADLGTTFGSFTIIGAESKNGGTLCCLPGTVDTVKPVILNCLIGPITASVPADGCSTPVSWAEPTATDSCPVELIPTHSPGDIFQLGDTEVEYTATDTNGNQETCSFTVTVYDNTKPVITGCPAIDIKAIADATCQAKVSWTEPTATDNCGSATITSDRHPGEFFLLGPTLVTYTAMDGKGNVSTCIFNVIVEDKTKPVITNCPVDIVTTLDSSCEVKVSWQTPGASDNCSSPIPSSNYDPGDVFLLGETEVIYTATDPGGNSTTCSFKVKVSNPTNPEVKGCPSNITVNATKEDSVAVTWEEPVATVLCGKLDTVQSHEPGDKFPIGTTTVEYEFTDETGKSSACSFNVLVLEPEALFAISKVVTPDGDGINDIWLLSNIENFKSNTVVVIDRWGNRIFQATGYDNVRTFWNGTNGSGALVPTGTYFYTIEVRDQNKVVQKKGFLEVIQ